MFMTWENLGDHFAYDKRVVIAEIDCEPSKNYKVCKAMTVNQYPSYILFKNSKAELKLSGRQSKKTFIELVENLFEPVDLSLL